MRTVAPQNTAIGQFHPSHESPIYPYTTRLYPCQEEVAYKTNEFRNLTWKIQQPDASMVWSKVKIVLPLAIRCKNAHHQPCDMRLASRLPSCNVALAETPMRAFRESTLSINGRTFSELNFYRDTLDACYRGHAPQQYGDNHSLKPIATRDLRETDPDNHVMVVDPATGAPQDGYSIRVSDITEQCAASSNSLLNSNGPFVERARLWQDNLSADGKTWTGEVTAYLELGPFANRDRGSSDVPAVPYIRDFYLRLQFANQPSKFDTLHNKGSVSRTIASLLLEYGLPPHILFPGDSAGWPNRGFAHDFEFMWTKKPFLEVMYTKFMGSMNTEYRLRCFERQYEQDARFKLEPDPATESSASQTVRIVTRLNSYPNKIYLYCEPADEYKGAFITGGCRRSCTLRNIHCRINQRSEVLFSPSQEECFEMFQRNCASDLDYASWSKAPVYVFTPADLGQPDMVGNDARITWMEWTAEASLTPLQCQERICQTREREMNACGYYHGILDVNTDYRTQYDQPGLRVHGSMSAVKKSEYTSSKWRKGDDDLTYIDLSYEHSSAPTQPVINYEHAGNDLRLDAHQMFATWSHEAMDTDDPPTKCDFTPIGRPREKHQRFDGFIWALVNMSTGEAGTQLYYVPESFPFITTSKDRSTNYMNDPSLLTCADNGTYGDGTVKSKYTVDMSSAMMFQAQNEQSGEMIGQPIGQGVNKAQGVGKAWICDQQGIRGQDQGSDTSKGPSDGSGTFQQGADYTVPRNVTNNENSDPRRWFCFYPHPNMFDGTDKTLTWLFSRNTKGPEGWLAKEDETTYASNHSHPIERVTCKFRTISEGNKNTAENMTAHQLAAGVEIQADDIPRKGYSLQKIAASAQHFLDVGWEYQLKTIYENTNAQYVFGDRGQPTKVMDNLRGV